MKMLLVDDSSADRRLYRALLSERPPLVPAGERIEIFEAAEALEGLRKCQEISPDCVLLDYRLPDMDGLEFLDRLPEFCPGEQPSCAVVMLTGVASERVAVDAMRTGAQDYLVKDRVSPEALSMAVDKAMQKVALIRDLRAERDQLAALLKEKEILVQEVHHRVKNNLQVVASLLRLQAEALPDPSAANVLLDSQHRVEAMAMIHEQLYESETVKSLDLALHARVLLGSLFAAYAVDSSRIRHEIRMEEPSLVLSADQAIPAGLILNELVSNALKHAFPGDRRGTIWIEGRRDAGHIQLSVSDDGAGLKPGVDPRNSKSLGLQIVQVLTRQLKGTVEIDSQKGTRFQIRFPEGTSKFYGAANGM